MNEESNKTADKSPIKIIAITIACIIVVTLCMVFVPKIYDKITRKAIAVATENAMDDIKDGLTSEQYDQIKQGIMRLATKKGLPEELVSFMADKVTEEDMEYLYEAFIRHMDYEILDVEKIGSTRYRETIVISNVDMKQVLVKMAKDKYFQYDTSSIVGKVLGGISDIKAIFDGDLSKGVANAMIKAGNDISENTVDGYVSQEVSIEISKASGKWKPQLDDEKMAEIIMAICGVDIR